MKFRVARHTNNLEDLRIFYTNVVGLDELGSFKGHDGYNGVFVGIPNENWHLEFTENGKVPFNSFDSDDLLVFYLNNNSQLEEKRVHVLGKGIKLLNPKNPYWNNNAIYFKDPDGFGIIFAVSPNEK